MSGTENGPDLPVWRRQRREPRDCRVCGAPMVFSSSRARVWCAVWGDHPDLGATPAPDNVVPIRPAAPSLLMIAADAELYGPDVDPLYARGKVR